MRDTIFALSSGQPPAAIAIMRISGPSADHALATLLMDGPLPAPRKAALRALRANGELLDTALVLRFAGPGSATGEDLVELHLHGGRATVAAIEGALADIEGLRIAEPGEFTRRAFESGRLDLSAVEGLADLLRAETQDQRRAATRIASGGLTRFADQLRVAVLQAAARVEATIEFADEDDVLPWPERHAVLTTLAADVAAVLAHPPAERLHHGIRVALAGPPNAGKSSLFNALVAREAAIVSPLEGTTRDVIEAPVVLRGIPFVFMDTAGLRESTDDPIEAIGISRAGSVIADCDIVIWLGPFAARPTHPDLIAVHPKADLAPPDDAGSALLVSSHTGQGMVALGDAIVATARRLLPPADGLALNRRQIACLKVVHQGLINARAGDPLIAAEHLRYAREAIDRLTGRAGTEDMLDSLFGTFCIGK